MVTKAVAAGVLAMTLAACGGGGGDSIDTGAFSPEVRERVNGLADSADCASLQAEFDQADENGNVDLMKYVDEAMKSARCY